MDSPLNTTIGVRMNAYLTSPDDFRKQRKRINKRIAKLRHDLGLVTRDTKQYKTKEKTSGITVQDYEKDPNYGLVLLLTAERDVLYALEIKNTLEISNEHGAGQKNLMVSRLKKALNTSKKILELAQNEASALVRIELYIFAALIQGQLSVTKKQWELARTSYSIARVGLEFWTAVQKEGEKEFQGEDVFEAAETLEKELVDNVIDPSLNLALSQMDARAVDIKSVSRKHCHDENLPYLSPTISIIKAQKPDLVSEISSTELIDSIEWRGHEAQIYNDEVAYNIMALLKTDENTDYDILGTNWSNVLDIHSQDIERNNDEDDMEKSQNRAILLTYIKYNLLFASMKRDLLIIDDITSSKTYRNVVPFYDNIITITQDLKELPGVYNDEELHQSLEDLEKYFNAKKCIYVANLYIATNKYAEALTIYLSLKDDFITEEQFTKFEEFPYNITSNIDFEKYAQDFNAKFLHAHALAHNALESKDIGSIVENSNKFQTGLELVDLATPPKIHSILSKPVLFDISYNYINYDLGRSSSAAPVSTSPAPQTSAEDQDGKKRGATVSMKKQGLLVTLVFCVAGLYGSFLSWSVLQERINTKPYGIDGSYEPEYFKAPLVVNIVQALFASIIGLVYSSATHGNPFLIFTNQKLISLQYFKWFLLISITSSLSSPLGYESLKHVDYLAYLLAKSCKLIPVMLVHLVMYGTRFPVFKYVVAGLVTAGVAVFTSSHTSLKTSINDGKTGLGMAQLIGSMVLDGLTNLTQDQLFKSQQGTHRVTGASLMCILNLFVFVLTAAYTAVFKSSELTYTLDFVHKYPEVLTNILAFAVFGSVGQVFVFVILEKFDSLVLITATVTRKMLSMILSVVLFGHNLTGVQWLGVGLVFGGVGFEGVKKAQGPSVKPKKE
ncbi:UAA-domain-containing protein [Suhomyces tanzawaensis NRRL Y-17324]|uniref:UDP-galactose transporter homolog 1 n=1 Tax=Suhomyces tanzawaensis NRRL Y-17324 TaxID=984487 RepID=A0A1E4SIN4_9ASCO|nr:UAA-domain-containing protein [Suhomyces tanzawaensis NRRL Y-17324]ODV79358.1 UAA-domain-containing protein [Suhomyces tanzawaensis NRRL Y-17324]